jgi:hypothetical protein
MSTGTYKWVAGEASLIVEGELPEELFRELEGRYQAMKLAHWRFAAAWTPGGWVILLGHEMIWAAVE